jgi:hypothetical protein
VASRHKECTLLPVELDLVPSHITEGFGEICKEVVLPIGLDDHIIDVDLDVATELARKALLHEPLVDGFGVLETEGLGCVTEGTKRHDEGHVFLIFDNHFDLVVAGVCVKKARLNL